MAWQRVAVLAVAGLLYVSALLNGVQAQVEGQRGYMPCPLSSMKVTSSGVLRATCRNNAGKNVATSIDLNLHLSNVDGELVKRRGFVASCSLSWPLNSLGGGSILFSAYCTDKKGKIDNFTSFDLNYRIANYNGKLRWNQCRRRALLESTQMGDNRVLDESTPLGGRKVLAWS